MAKKKAIISKIPSKPFIEIMKDIKYHIAWSKGKINEFINELKLKEEEQKCILSKANETQNRIIELRHLIEMYKVMDSHKLSDLWKLETACGMTKLKYLDWELEYNKKLKAKKQ